MAETISTNTDAIIVGHGLMCLASHMIQHQLPTPLSVQLNTERLAVAIPSDPETVAAWNDSLAGVSAPEWVGTTLEVYRHYEAAGTLPDTGVRVRLAWIAVVSAVKA